MNTVEYTKRRIAQLESMCADTFAQHIEIDEILFDDIDAPHDALLTVFSSHDGRLFATVEAPTAVSLQDVKRVVRAANLTSEHFYTPANNPDYFKKAGWTIFLNTYPGRSHWTKLEEQFYATQAPYNPSLIRLVPKSAELRRFNSLTGSWQRTYDQLSVEAAFRKATYAHY